MLGAGLALGLAGCEKLSELSEPGKEGWRPAVAAARPEAPAPRAPCRARSPRRRALFGDLHVHTGYSMDARTWGLTVGPDAAYRYARGETITLTERDGRERRLRIDRPLDFAAVTDHAEWMGEVALCTTPGSAAFDTEGCRIFRDEKRWWLARLLGLQEMASRVAGIAGFRRRSREICGDDASVCREALFTTWEATRAAAERWYDRSPACRFTTFHAWEYSRTPANTKLHRNVILRNEIGPELPLSWIDSPTDADLRRRLRTLCTESGTACDALVIPHNPNLSNGHFFAVDPEDGSLAEQRARARERAALEPLVEMVQIKGESECRNGLYGVVGGPDELCDFEKKRDLPGGRAADCEEGTGRGGQAGRGCISRLDYVRYALLEGLREEARIGVNPYRFGFIGSTDTHLAAPGGVDEASPDAPLGRLGLGPRRRLSPRGTPPSPILWHNPGGLVGVWAEENSRDAIFDALKRREAFATSGPRIRPRLFAGWNLPEDLCGRPDFAGEGDARGVPMGAVLPPAPGPDAAPVLAVSALRDPGTEGRPGGLLQRLQIIKGWVDDEGLFHQAVFDVAGEPDNGADVDLTNCTPRGPGAAALCAVWRDPDFEAGRASVYYARVVENPSCRWSTWQCLAQPADDRPAGCSDPRVPRVIQERAWTSPVWYAP